MSFKHHLIIIAAIIVAVYGIWQWRSSRAVAPEPAPVVKASKYNIEIIHASWGLNCAATSGNQPVNTSDPYAGGGYPARRAQEDNVLQSVSQLCNGKLKCQVPVTAAALGGNPAPECNGKELFIEYRCFSYDRPWYAKATSGAVTINCDRES